MRFLGKGAFPRPGPHTTIGDTIEQVGEYLYGFIVGLPNTSRGHDAIWVIGNQLTNMCCFISTSTMVTTPHLARLFIDSIYSLYGLRGSIIRDRV